MFVFNLGNTGKPLPLQGEGGGGGWIVGSRLRFLVMTINEKARRTFLLGIKLTTEFS